MSKEYEPFVNVASTVKAPFEAIVFDMFEDIPNWYASGTTGYTIKKVVDTSGVQPFVLEIRTRSATPTAGDYADIYARVPYPSSKYMKVRAVFRPKSTACKVTLRASIGEHLATDDPRIASVRLDSSAGKLEYGDTEIHYTDVKTGLMAPDGAAYVTLEMVLDIGLKKYKSVSLGGKVYDLSAHDIPTSATSDPQASRIFVEVENTGASQQWILLRSVLAMRED